MSIELLKKEDVKIAKGRGTDGKYETGIQKHIQWLKGEIQKAPDGIIRIKSKKFATELGPEFEKIRHTSIYWGLKRPLFNNHNVVVESAIHTNGDKLLVFRNKDVDDVLPKSLKNRGKKSIDKELKITSTKNMNK